MRELRDDAREQSERTHAKADGDGDLVRVKTLWRLLGRGGNVGAHMSSNASGRRSVELDSSGNSPDQMSISRTVRGRVHERVSQGL